MTPQVRAIEPAPVAAPRNTPQPVSVNLLQVTNPVVEIKAPAPELTEEHGTSMLDKRRRRRARMSNRH